MKLLNKTLLFAFLIIGSFLGAQGPPPPPEGRPGGVGPGEPASPIDMYVYILAIAAILFIVLYVKRIQQKQTV
ncbi:signal peptidase [Kaistella sp.]|uniref:signal peptidase n=1 Tax=Kaistella sp. TaxID=2782235 RepID=UPI00359FBD42